MKNIIFSLIVASLVWGHIAVVAQEPQREESVVIVPPLTETPSQKQDRIEAENKARKAKTLARIEKSLNAIRSMKATFVQRAPDGSVVEGTVYLERPGKLRFDYGEDAPFLLVSNGKLLTFVDYEVNQVSRWPIKKTPLGILVDDEIKFDSKIEVPNIIRFAGLVKVPVIDPKRQEYGYIILIFEESTMELRAWESVDAQGYTTRVALINPEYNIKIDKKQFTFKDPRPRRRGPRRR